MIHHHIFLSIVGALDEFAVLTYLKSRLGRSILLASLKCLIDHRNHESSRALWSGLWQLVWALLELFLEICFRFIKKGVILNIEIAKKIPTFSTVWVRFEHFRAFEVHFQYAQNKGVIPKGGTCINPRNISDDDDYQYNSIASLSKSSKKCGFCVIL